MDWIKKNYGKFTLILAAILLLALAGLLLSRVATLQNLFKEFGKTPPRSDEITPLPIAKIADTLKAVDAPPQWGQHKAPLFVSKLFLLVEGQPLAVLGGKNIHEPIPNEWVLLQNLDISQVDLRSQDPDGDKFTNEEEFLASTDPNSPNSKPPYHTLLKLTRVQRERNRVVFTSYTGSGTNVSAALNTLDLSQPTQFVRINDLIKGTKYRVTGFNAKKGKVKAGPTEYDKDVSELLIEDPESGIKAALILNTMTNLGEEQIWLDYRYNAQRMVLKKKQTFTLPPDNTKYQVAEIEAKSAVLHNIASNEDITLTEEKAP